MNVFEKILVPVDFSINTEVAINKAVALATPGITELYLLHVLPGSLLGNVTAAGLRGGSNETARSAETKLVRLRRQLAETQPSITTGIFIGSNSSVEAGLVSAAADLKPSLIIIGKNNRHSILPFLNTVATSSLAEATGCPVLTIKPGSMRRTSGTVVMPISDFYPKRKIDVLAALSSRLTLNVHLLTILSSQQHPDDYSASVLLQSMRSIRSRLKCNVQHSLIHSNNRAMATLRYAEQHNADMLLVNPESETTIHNWMQRKDITDLLKPASGLQVLSVQSQ